MTGSTKNLWRKLFLSLRPVWLLGAMITFFARGIIADDSPAGDSWQSEGSESTEEIPLEGKISNDLLQALEASSEPIKIVVMLKPIPLVPATLMGELEYGDLERVIKSATVQSQMDLREWVNRMVQTPMLQGEAPLSRYKFFWNVNALMATVRPELVSELADREDVEYVMLDRVIHLSHEPRAVVEESSGEFTYGLERMGIPELRSKYPGLTGAGVNVGILDTGLDASHPEFKGRQIVFRDFVGGKTEAYDDDGHGTHVAGTIGGSGAGGTQIGVAPQVNFTIGKILDGNGRGSLSGILRAMEWISDPDGNPGTPDRPRVVSNSWGGGPSRDLKTDPFFQAVQTWLQLEIFPSFAAGNSGPRASSVGSPGCLPIAFAVGATDEADQIASFSSRGPTKMTVDGKPEVFSKPDISAPGHDVISAAPGGGYAKMSGTSMATPHISGAIALILQLRPNAKVTEIRDLLMKTSLDLGSPGQDYSFGAGRVQMPKAVEVLLQSETAGLLDDWSI